MLPRCDCEESEHGKYFDGLENLMYIAWVEGTGVDFNTLRYCPWCGKDLKPVEVTEHEEEV